MLDQAEKIIKQALKDIEQATDSTQLETSRVNFLGKKGKLTELLKKISELPNDQKSQFGAALNKGKTQIQQQISLRREQLSNISLIEALNQDSIDVSLPAVGVDLGSVHPITKTFQLAAELFEKLGFKIVDGPEVEDEYYNFEALNIPFHHPARAMHDTFYFVDDKLLRTHTSSVQIRTMQTVKPPYKLISMGKVYRCDSDLTHTPMFHQIEGLLVDKGVNFGNLTWILTEFLRCFFAKQDLAVRFRPSYFPFTEPSAEVDMQCVNCNGKGCKVCKHTGWLEILGCGMVHPQVLKNCGVDSDEYTGLAFGIGIDRLAMLRHGINDLRLMFENDLRFLQQF
jgi:phenylalanyl-tRNA synthetase alpha chain